MARGRYEIEKNALGEYTFRLTTISGKTVAHSAPYKNLAVCKKGIASLRINSDAPLEDNCVEEGSLLSLAGEKKAPLRCPKIEMFKETGGVGSYNYTVKAKNGTVIARGEGYGTKMRCLEAIETLRYIAFSAETTEKRAE